MLLANKRAAKATKSKRPPTVAKETNSKSGAKATKSNMPTPVAKETKSKGNFLERFVELATKLIMNATTD